MLFIWVVNLLGFIPLPLTGETWHGVPVWGIYAATSSLSVTLALALLTFVFTHFEGIRWNGPVRYFKSWIPEAPTALLARSEEHTSELQSHSDLVCRLL